MRLSTDGVCIKLLTRWFPSVLKTITIVRPETFVRWHHAGFRRYWRWKSPSLGGPPPLGADLARLIRRLNTENKHLGAPGGPGSIYGFAGALPRRRQCE